MNAMRPAKNYDLVEITRLLLKMRDNCVRKAEDEAYDDPERKEKYDALNDAIDLINAPSLLRGWISVKDRLPEDGQKVLVCGTRKGMQVGVFRGLMHPFDAMGWWWKKDTRLDVTHWMPLPEPPEEEA